MDSTLPRVGLAAMLALVCACPSCGREAWDETARVREAARLAQLQWGMPWESVRADTIHARRITAIAVEASENLECPSIRLLPSAPLPKDTGLRAFDGLGRIEVDHLSAHHVEAANIAADEIVAVEILRPGASRFERPRASLASDTSSLPLTSAK